MILTTVQKLQEIVREELRIADLTLDSTLIDSDAISTRLVLKMSASIL